MLYGYRTFFVSLALLFGAPFLVSADGYGGPYCFEEPGYYADVADLGVANGGIRGSCKFVKKQDVVSVDPILQKDYFLGMHSSIEYGCEINCGRITRYSESLWLTGTSTIIGDSTDYVNSVNLFQYALFSKAYFVPLLSKMLKEQGIVFSKDNMPRINIYNKSEINEGKKISGLYPDDPIFAIDGLKMDSVITEPDGSYIVNTFNSDEYHKYIYAPKKDLVEPQYTDFNDKKLSDEDLQIKEISVKRSYAYVVPVTNPLRSVVDYWMYTKNEGRLTLAWQKSEYTLDNGQVKVITNADKNITAALLFSNDFPSSATTPPSLDLASSTPALPTATEQKKGFFAHVFDVILSWFR